MADSEHRATDDEERGVLQPAPSGGVPTPPEADGRSLGEAIVRSGETPARILDRLGTGDPLQLVELCAQQQRARMFLIDVERLFERSILRVAQGAPLLERDMPLEEWLIERIDVAIMDILRVDHERMIAGDLPWRSEHHLFMEEWMCMEPAQAFVAAARFNQLAEPVRRAFFELMVDGKSVAECLEAGLGPPEVLRKNGQDAVVALLGVHFKDEHNPSANLRGDR